MTTSYPTTTSHSLEALLTEMEVLSANWQTLAPLHCCLALLNLHPIHLLLEQDQPCDWLSRLLTPAELELFRGFRYDKRRREWLGGRIAAKHASRLMNPAKDNPSFMFHDCSILPGEHGIPIAIPSRPGLPAVSVSISHSAGYAAALACAEGCCGIDIQRKNPSLHKVQERFATEEELAAFGPVRSSLTRLGLLWTAKEAVKKCLLADHPSFFGAIKLNSVRHEPQEGIWTAQCDLNHLHRGHAMVRMGEMGEHLIACARGERNA